MERAAAAARKTLAAARTVAAEAAKSLAEAQAEAAEAEAAVEALGTPRGLRRLVGRRGRRRLREALEAAREEAAKAGPRAEGHPASWQCRAAALASWGWLDRHLAVTPVYVLYSSHCGRRRRTRRWRAKD